MKECKYRLPCDWCDKFNKKCEEVDYCELPDPNNCDHDWVYDKRVITTVGQCDYYHCAKCKAIKLVNGDVAYESGKWKP